METPICVLFELVVCCLHFVSEILSFSFFCVVSQDKARTNYVGFANLPNQVFRKAVKKGFQFTLMVAGQSGLGKSTLLNSLFLTSLYEDSVYNPSSVRLAQTTEVKESTVHIEENGVKLELTLVDSPGFGELVDNSQWYVRTYVYTCVCYCTVHA
jgi:ribosome biogenesis GTPase A